MAIQTGLTKQCIKCLICKPLSEWYLRKKTGTPLGKYCKECKRERGRERWNQPGEHRERGLLKKKEYQKENRQAFLDYGEKYYASKVGRAKILLKSAKLRGAKLGIDIDESFILNLMENDSCSVTNIKFDYNRSKTTTKNPYAPSLDRIDSKRGYLKDNVRLVIWQYNLMKGEISDDELFSICQGIVNARN